MILPEEGTIKNILKALKPLTFALILIFSVYVISTKNIATSNNYLQAFAVNDSTDPLVVSLANNSDGTIVLSNEIKKRYIDLLSSILDRKRDYKAIAGIRRKDGYQRMEEITIMKMKCMELRDFINNEKGTGRFEFCQAHGAKAV